MFTELKENTNNNLCKIRRMIYEQKENINKELSVYVCLRITKFLKPNNTTEMKKFTRDVL